MYVCMYVYIIYFHQLSNIELRYTHFLPQLFSRTYLFDKHKKINIVLITTYFLSSYDGDCKISTLTAFSITSFIHKSLTRIHRIIFGDKHTGFLSCTHTFHMSSFRQWPKSHFERFSLVTVSDAFI